MWTDLDRVKAKSYEEHRAGYCEKCGTRREWWDPKQGGHRHAMVADIDRCPGCETIEQLQEQVDKDEKGVTVKLYPNPELTGEEEPDDG